MTHKRPTLMFVDDSTTILRTAKSFATPNYNVITAEDGFVAMAEIINHKPDILFVDVLMPKLNGYETCLAIKSNPEFEDLKIVILSSKNSPFDIAKGKLMGCSDYLSKPFNKDELLATVNRLLSKNESE